MPELVLKGVVAFIKQETGVDLSGLLAIIDPLTTDVSGIIQALEGIDLSNPGAVLAALTAPLQAIIAAIVGGTTGQASTGTDPVSVLFSLLNQGLSLPGDLVALIFGGQATTQAQINALQNGGFSHDFASLGVTGWTNLVNTLAVSTRGGFIQAATETVAYRSSGTSVDKYGVNIVINPSMQGTCRIGICSDTSGSRWAGLEIYRGFDGDAIRLVVGASPTLTAVLKQVDLTDKNKLSGMTSIDLRTDGVNQFSVLYNNQPVPALNFTDSGGLFTHDSSHRNILLTSNGFNRNEDSFYGPAITKVVSYAW
jgi:hypothetical protein